MKLSIVTTLYRSSQYIDEFLRLITKYAIEVAGQDYEVIVVDDGCPESTGRKLVMEVTNPKIRVITLSRNFGHHKAILCGLDHSAGDRVFVIDCDLEEDPQLLIEFWGEMDSGQFDLVNGRQLRRKGGTFEKVSGGVFYAILSWLSKADIEADLTIAKLMSKRFCNALKSHRESAYFLGGIQEITGFRKRYVNVMKGSKGGTVYTFSRKLRQSLDAIISFSTRPLYLVVMVGIILAIIGFLYLIYILCMKAVEGAVEGWTSILAALLLSNGFIIVAVGVLGIYLAKVFEETKRRPLYIVESDTWLRE